MTGRAYNAGEQPNEPSILSAAGASVSRKNTDHYSHADQHP
ncbi:hypothetical protein EDF59_12496 [Novosphingobium sp. ST904]|nr:hypothetical protein EDF59_12496 [Novosphingobium sp. ST904]